MKVSALIRKFCCVVFWCGVFSAYGNKIDDTKSFSTDKKNKFCMFYSYRAFYSVDTHVDWWIEKVRTKSSDFLENIKKGHAKHYFVSCRLYLCGTQSMFMGAESASGARHLLGEGGWHGTTGPSHATGLVLVFKMLLRPRIDDFTTQRKFAFFNHLKWEKSYKIMKF